MASVSVRKGNIKCWYTGWVLKSGPPKMWLYTKFEGLIPNVLGTIIASYKYRNDDKK